MKKLDPHFALAAFAVCSSFFLILGLFFVPVPPNNKEMVNVFVPIYISGSMVISYNFFFGNTKKQTDANTQTTVLTEEKTLRADKT